MSGITGIVNVRKKIDFETENVRGMTNTLMHRGKGIQKVKNSGYGVFGCAAFESIWDKERQIPFSIICSIFLPLGHFFLGSISKIKAFIYSAAFSLDANDIDNPSIISLPVQLEHLPQFSAVLSSKQLTQNLL